MRHGSPWDILCCFVNYKLKEITHRAHEQEELPFNGSWHIHFRTFAFIMLNPRRALRPIVSMLKDRNISYRWWFLFTLCFTRAGNFPFQLLLICHNFLSPWLVQGVPDPCYLARTVTTANWTMYSTPYHRRRQEKPAWVSWGPQEDMWTAFIIAKISLMTKCSNCSCFFSLTKLSCYIFYNSNYSPKCLFKSYIAPIPIRRKRARITW